MSIWDFEKDIVLKTAQHMAQNGLVVGTSGNVSMRLNERDGKELLAITPSGRNYDTLQRDDIVIVSFDGERIEGKFNASIETTMHIEIYKSRRNINAIIHTHSVYGSAVSVAGLDIPPILDDQVIYLGGEIKVTEYAPTGSDELTRNVISALGPRNAVILANHGTLGIGRDIDEAFTNCERLEHIAKIYIQALGIGKINLLSETALEVDVAHFNILYGEQR
ncbi:MAG: class II aldolase/adducin family protein [Chloroflexota bacterium]|nr:class II aldolase/adducin family protein [Chloroflexota bacterium]